MASSEYTLIYGITVEAALLQRLYACAAVEADRADRDNFYPEPWVSERRYEYAATPGWSAAVASAEASGNENWGSDPGVITDGMILSRTQELLAEDPPPAGPPGQS